MPDVSLTSFQQELEMLLEDLRSEQHHQQIAPFLDAQRQLQDIWDCDVESIDEEVLDPAAEREIQLWLERRDKRLNTARQIKRNRNF